MQGFSLKALKHLVLDEADRLLNMDFEQEIDQILKALPPSHSPLYIPCIASNPSSTQTPLCHVLLESRCWRGWRAGEPEGLHIGTGDAKGAEDAAVFSHHD